MRLGGESPLWALVTGTTSLSKGVRGDPGSERKLMTELGANAQKPNTRLAPLRNSPGTDELKSHSRAARVDLVAAKGMSHNLPYETLLVVFSGTTRLATSGEGQQGVSRGHGRSCSRSTPLGHSPERRETVVERCDRKR